MNQKTSIWAGQRDQRDLTPCSQRIFIHSFSRPGLPLLLQSSLQSTQNPLPGSHQKKVAGHRIDKPFWWHKGLSSVLSILSLSIYTHIHTVVIVRFATEITRGQGMWREQSSNLEQLCFVCLELLCHSPLSLSTIPKQVFLHAPSSHYFLIQHQKQGMHTPPCPSFFPL